MHGYVCTTSEVKPIKCHFLYLYQKLNRLVVGLVNLSRLSEETFSMSSSLVLTFDDDFYSMASVMSFFSFKHSELNNFGSFFLLLYVCSVSLVL